MTDQHDQAIADVQRRQHEICQRIFAEARARDGEAAGVKTRVLNEALVAAGLPMLPKDTSEAEAIINGRDADPAMTALMLTEFSALCRTAPGWHDGMTMGAALASLGLTLDQAEAECQRRVAERLGGRAQ